MKRFKKKRMTIKGANQMRVGMRSQTPLDAAPAFRPRVRSRHIVGLVVFISMAAVLGQIYLSISFSSKGTELAVLLAKKEALREENDILKTELAGKVSVIHIASQAEMLGLDKPKTMVFIKPQDETRPLAFDTTKP